MIIDQVNKYNKGFKTFLSAKVTFRDKKSEILYFSVNKEFRPFLVDDASPFLAGCLIPAFINQEEIKIKGNVSKKLLNNVEKIRKVLNKWHLGLVKKKLNVTNALKDNFNSSKSALFFSAGVDSFYSYYKHKKSSTNKGVEYLVLINGFDISLENKIFFQKVYENISSIAKKENLKIIVVDTNLRPIIEQYALWDWIHGGALAAVALLLRKKIRNIYIAANVNKEILFPYGTHPDLDPLWGTETLKVIHDGIEASRQDKVKKIAKYKLVADYLKVCNQNLKGIYNCCECSKCLKTMIEFEAADQLKKMRTFPLLLNLKKVETLYFDYKQKYHHMALDSLKLLRKSNRNVQLQNALLKALEMSKKRKPLKQKILTLAGSFDRKYNNRRFYKWIFSTSQKQDRNLMFKFLSLGGFLK